jgi:hypothetical protein
MMILNKWWLLAKFIPFGGNGASTTGGLLFCRAAAEDRRAEVDTWKNKITMIANGNVKMGHTWNSTKKTPRVLRSWAL